MPPLHLRHVATGPRLFRRLHRRTHRDAIAAHAWVLRQEPCGAVPLRALGRTVTVPNQIRTVLEAFRDNLFTDLFPGRTEVPKTLIFAKDDHHAEEIVTIAREVFGFGNDFAKKITYRVSGATPKELIT